MIDGLGRYEFVGGNSNKFWHIYLDKASDTYVTEWGKIGYQAQGRKAGLSEGEAQGKIREKVNKGYIHSGGFTGIKKALTEDFSEDRPEKRQKVTKVSIGHTKRKLDLD